MFTAIKKYWRNAQPRTPEMIAEQVYRRYAYSGHHRYMEPVKEPAPEPEPYRLKPGWRWHLRAPIPVVEVFR